VAESAGQLGAKLGAGWLGSTGAELVDHGPDVGIRELGRARHARIITENNGNSVSLMV
jgi:hypothetical protein